MQATKLAASGPDCTAGVTKSALRRDGLVVYICLLQLLSTSAVLIIDLSVSKSWAADVISYCRGTEVRVAKYFSTASEEAAVARASSIPAALNRRSSGRSDKEAENQTFPGSASSPKYFFACASLLGHVSAT